MTMSTAESCCAAKAKEKGDGSEPVQNGVWDVSGGMTDDMAVQENGRSEEAGELTAVGLDLAITLWFWRQR